MTLILPIDVFLFEGISSFWKRQERAAFYRFHLDNNNNNKAEKSKKKHEPTKRIRLSQSELKQALTKRKTTRKEKILIDRFNQIDL